MFNFITRLVKGKQKPEKKVDNTWEKASQSASDQIYVLIFFAFVIAVVYLAYYSIKGMFAVGFLTVLFGMLLWPLYKKINQVLPGPDLFASIVTIILSIVIVVIPLLLVGKMLFDQFVVLASMFDVNEVQQTLTVTVENFNNWVSQIPVFGPYLVVDYTAVVNSIMAFLGTITTSIVNIIYSSGQSAVRFFIDFFLIVALLFYALPDMGKLKRWVVKSSPFSRQTTKLYLKRSQAMMLDVIRGSFVVSFVQALLSAVFLIALQVPTAGIIAILVFFLSLLPIFGSGIVLVPVAIYYMITGNWVNGIAILLYQVLIVASVDNVLRPILVSDESNIHPALMLLAVTGGIATMGMMGLLYGPLIMILFLTTIEVYNKEFKPKR